MPDPRDQQLADAIAAQGLPPPGYIYQNGRLVPISSLPASVQARINATAGGIAAGAIRPADSPLVIPIQGPGLSGGSIAGRLAGFGTPTGGAAGYQSGPNPVFGSGGLPSGVPGAPGGGGGGINLGGWTPPTTLGGWGGQLLDWGKRGIGWLAENPEVPLAVVGAIQGYRQQRNAERNDAAARAMLEEQAAAMRPLRDAGIAGLAGLQRPDLGGLVRDPYNPYNPRAEPAPLPATGTPSPAAPGGRSGRERIGNVLGAPSPRPPHRTPRRPGGLY